jgi:hypothetical protein
MAPPHDIKFRMLSGPLHVGALLVISCIAVVAAQMVQQSHDQSSILPISAELCKGMKQRHVLTPQGPVPCSRLRLVNYSYVDFEGQPHNDGEIVVMDVVADSVLNIFDALRAANFPIAKAQLMNVYDGNDDASMAENNTSAFNDRAITGGRSISLHAYGLAIDINPVQNPFLKRANGSLTVSPPAGAAYMNRQDRRPGMSEPIIDIFADNGFLIWGGSWKDPIDYQHFQVGRKMAEHLARVSPSEAAKLFSSTIERYRACRQTAADKEQPDRQKCILAADPTAK